MIETAHIVQIAIGFFSVLGSVAVVAGVFYFSVVAVKQVSQTRDFLIRAGFRRGFANKEVVAYVQTFPGVGAFIGPVGIYETDFGG